MECYLNDLKKEIMLPVVAIIAIIVIVIFIVFAGKKKKQGEGLGDRNAGKNL